MRALAHTWRRNDDGCDGMGAWIARACSRPRSRDDDDDDDDVRRRVTRMRAMLRGMPSPVLRRHPHHTFPSPIVVASSSASRERGRWGPRARGAMRYRVCFVYAHRVRAWCVVVRYFCGVRVYISGVVVRRPRPRPRPRPREGAERVAISSPRRGRRTSDERRRNERRSEMSAIMVRARARKEDTTRRTRTRTRTTHARALDSVGVACGG